MILTSKDFRIVVGEGVGVASMCWVEIPKGTFDTARAQSVVEEIMAYYDRDMESLRAQVAELMTLAEKKAVQEFVNKLEIKRHDGWCKCLLCAMGDKIDEIMKEMEDGK